MFRKYKRAEQRTLPILFLLSCPEVTDLLKPSLKKENTALEASLAKMEMLVIKGKPSKLWTGHKYKFYKGSLIIAKCLADNKQRTRNSEPTYPVREQELPGNSMRVPSVLTRSGVGEGPISATGEVLLILWTTLPSSSSTSSSPSSPPNKSSTPWDREKSRCLKHYKKGTKAEYIK